VSTASHRSGRVVVAGLARDWAEAAAFDREFWEGVAPPARLEALWDMVLEHEAWLGEDERQPRLQRSVLRVERR
jgi:hypothetical protein